VRRILLVLVVLVLGTVGVVAVATAQGPAAPVPPARSAPAVVSSTPADGAADVGPGERAAVTVQDGTLADVALTGPDGPVPGGGDATGWTTTADLAYDATYVWSGTVTGADGAVQPLTGSFTTVDPDEIVRGVLNIGDDRTVGVAAPIQIQFDAHVEDRAAVERALSVGTSVPVEGAWGWLPDENGGSRVHWRPREYWPAGTEVTVTADLFGVAYGGGAYGRADVTSTFAIGRSQIVRADVTSHRMVVVRDGVPVADYPASYGLTGDPDRTTRSGIHVVTELHPEKRMTSDRYGYDLVVDWAVRISNNGEFVHANPASAAAQGSANVTHGCINLSTADARAYFESALYGDPVEVTGSGVPLAERDGDVWDWTLSWEQWQGLSAL
jgi:lipoprotein-anchoring transpeptidase ErfK/SrfK